MDCSARPRWAALRDAAVLHYELFPYLYGLLRRGEPVLRPLGYGYPDDPQVVGAPTYELLVGPDLLAAPGDRPGHDAERLPAAGRAGSTSTPARPCSGGRVVHARDAADRSSRSTRATGAVVPFNLRTRPARGGASNEQTHPGRAGFLATNGATLDLRGQPKDVQLFVPAPARPRRVTIGGRAVALDAGTPGPLPGVVDPRARAGRRGHGRALAA